MKYLSILPALLLILGATGNAQEAKFKVDCKKVDVSVLPTPGYTTNLPDRRWRPKNWIQIDVDFDVKIPSAAGGRDGTLDALTMNYYVAMNTRTPEGKTPVFKGTINYVNIANGENHALAFISPSSLKRLMQKDNVIPSDIQATAVEILYNGQPVAGKSNGGGAGRWWETGGDSLDLIDGDVLAKHDTPYSVLWGDYDVKAKK